MTPQGPLNPKEEFVEEFAKGFDTDNPTNAEIIEELRAIVVMENKAPRREIRTSHPRMPEMGAETTNHHLWVEDDRAQKMNNSARKRTRHHGDFSYDVSLASIDQENKAMVLTEIREDRTALETLRKIKEIIISLKERAVSVIDNIQESDGFPTRIHREVDMTTTYKDPSKPETAQIKGTTKVETGFRKRHRHIKGVTNFEHPKKSEESGLHVQSDEFPSKNIVRATKKNETDKNAKINERTQTSILELIKAFREKFFEAQGI